MVVSMVTDTPVWVPPGDFDVVFGSALVVSQLVCQKLTVAPSEIRGVISTAPASPTALTNPSGFKDAAVASSATVMKAPLMPWARAPEQTGIGAEASPTCSKMVKLRISTARQTKKKCL